MGWKCEGCGATVDPALKECDYCGRHRAEANHQVLIHKNEEKTVKPIDTFDKISTSLDPVKNYQSTPNSIKPNFEQKDSISSEKIIIFVVILLIIVWLLN